jgi:hypothetical protein
MDEFRNGKSLGRVNAKRLNGVRPQSQVKAVLGTLPECIRCLERGCVAMIGIYLHLYRQLAKVPSSSIKCEAD